MTKKPRKRPTSVKYYLVRDFNFRMGNLQRLRRSAGALDDDLQQRIWETVTEQMDREQERHEGRLMAIASGDPAGLIEIDLELQTAVWRAQRG